MTVLIDLVNFNADASCFDSAAWLRALAGGHDSEFCRWLRLYIDLEKKVSLGLTGGTIADLHAHNPEALALIRRHDGIFEPIARPFSHDIPLIRGRAGFLVNLDLGLRAARREFGRLTLCYLPPEFMLSHEQVGFLATSGVATTFVNAERLASDLRGRVPDDPYQVQGVDGASLNCLPVQGSMTRFYLDALHAFDAASWNAELAAHARAIAWRDGESPFLIPDGIARERAWLEGERGAQRQFLHETDFSYRAAESLPADMLRSYPVHSFLAWMQEFRMVGYLGRLQRMEQEVSGLSLSGRALWLQAINSDVFSSVEKRSPEIRLRLKTGDEIRYTILRSERGFEGHEVLYALEQLVAGDAGPFERMAKSGAPQALKLRGRIRYLEGLG